MRNIPTKAVKAVVRNANNEILFLRRHKLREGPTNWDLPGGLLDQGEDEKQALAREVEEELGAKPLIGKTIGTWSFLRPFDGERVQVTNFEVALVAEAIALSDEHDEARWFSESELAFVSLKDSSILEALS